MGVCRRNRDPQVFAGSLNSEHGSDCRHHVSEISLGGLGQRHRGRPGLEQVAERVLETLLGAIEECLLDGGPVQVGREQPDPNSRIRLS